ncbi:hypothetical protein [Paramagnetospirillum marisnigri]|uniref:hypothetical protein n=1 Tax=Paramagnetospirillum marisnigri TaxID=1285242 RepID=UPI000AE30C54|nr:hypothetical protein [Paramagnetospirillum marisnigri]
MGQKAARREKLAAIRERALDVISTPETQTLMTRERALDSLGYLWEVEKERLGSLLAC